MEERILVQRLTDETDAVLARVREGARITVMGSHGRSLLTVMTSDGTLFEEDTEPAYDEEMLAAEESVAGMEAEEGIRSWLR